MFTTEFGGSIALPFILLGLAMSIGLAVYFWQKPRKGAKEQHVPTRRPRIEEELAAEIEAVREARGQETAPSHPVLEPSEEERARMQELKKKYGGGAE